jgi:hypothetical protein
MSGQLALQPPGSDFNLKGRLGFCGFHAEQMQIVPGVFVGYYRAASQAPTWWFNSSVATGQRLFWRNVGDV